MTLKCNFPAQLPYDRYPNTFQEMKSDSLLWRVLRKNISKGQLTGYAIANLVGLTIILMAMQFYRDIRTSLPDGSSDSWSSEFAVICRKVSPLGIIGNGNEGFTQADISDIQSQPWAVSAAPFKASLFDVSAAADFGGRGFSTALFFESVPDRFLDIQPQGWSFDPESGEVPIILSKDYLNLYNFGFAPARGLPLLTEKMIGLVPLRISISGHGRQTTLRGRIVGFSSRLNTIAVPETFMDWANENYANTQSENPSRLIVEMKNPGDPRIADFLATNGLETSKESGVSEKMAYILKIVCAVVVAIGGVICLLAIFILVLSVYLLVQKNREKLRDLMLLGFPINSLCDGYMRIIMTINASVAIASAIAVIGARSIWITKLHEAGITGASPLPAILTAAGAMAILTFINRIMIKSRIKKCI